MSPGDREFVEKLARQIAMKHGRRAMRIAPARAELAADIAQAIEVCVDIKVSADQGRRK